MTLGGVYYANWYSNSITITLYGITIYTSNSLGVSVTCFKQKDN